MKQAMIWTNKPDPGRTNFSRKMSLSALGAANAPPSGENDKPRRRYAAGGVR